MILTIQVFGIKGKATDSQIKKFADWWQELHRLFASLIKLSEANHLC